MPSALTCLTSNIKSLPPGRRTVWPAAEKFGQPKFASFCRSRTTSRDSDRGAGSRTFACRSVWANISSDRTRLPALSAVARSVTTTSVSPNGLDCVCRSMRPPASSQVFRTPGNPSIRSSTRLQIVFVPNAERGVLDSTSFREISPTRSSWGMSVCAATTSPTVLSPRALSCRVLQGPTNCPEKETCRRYSLPPVDTRSSTLSFSTLASSVVVCRELDISEWALRRYPSLPSVKMSVPLISTLLPSRLKMISVSTVVMTSCAFGCTVS